MPKYLRARAPHDDSEAGEDPQARGCPACPGRLDRAGPDRGAELDGLAVPAIAAKTGRQFQKHVRRWLHRFNAAGLLHGLGNQPGPGRKRRVTEAQRSAIIAMARSLPPGSWPATPPGNCPPAMSAARRSGPWTPSPRRPGMPASRWGAARNR